MHAQVEALVHQGRLEEAREICRQILADNPDTIRVIKLSARIERLLGDNAAASGHLRAALGLIPGDPSLSAELAAILRDQGRDDEATALYGQILARDERHAPSHLGLGWIARARGNHPEALTHFAAARDALRLAAEKDPGNIRIAQQLAMALRECGQLDEASELYNQVLAQEPAHAPSHLGLGWIARARQDTAAALVHFRAAAAADPGNLQTQVTLAKLLESVDRPEEAETIYRNAVVSAPRTVTLRIALGRLACARRDWPTALEAYGAAAQLDPANTPVRLEIGRVSCELGQWADAERTYRSILEETPDDVEAMIGLAETLRASGDRPGALALFMAAAAAAPLDLRPKKAIRQLKVAEGGYDWKTEIEEAAVIARSPAVPDGTRIEAAKTLVEHGLTEVARPVLASLEGRYPRAHQLMLAVRQMERMGLAVPVAADGVSPDAGEQQLESLQGWIAKPVAGSETLLLVFAGTNNRLWMTFSLLHKMLRTTGVSIVYVRDLQRDWYASGVIGLGEDFASTVGGFQRLVAQHQAKRILALGNCVGCLGALRFGLALGAQGVLGLGPKLRPREDLKPDERARLAAIRKRLSAGHKNVRAQYEAAARRPAVTLIYGADCTRDATDVRYMAEIPGIAAVGIPGSADPDSIKDLLVRGLLEPVLREFIASGDVSPGLRHRIVESAAAAEMAADPCHAS